MMNTWNTLRDACKKLKFSQSMVANAKVITEETHPEFLAKLLTKELEERDIKRRNTYIKTANFDVEKTFEKLDLLICDEWGYVPIDSDGAKLLFQVVSECYERKSIIITTNLEFSRWNDILPIQKSRQPFLIG